MGFRNITSRLARVGASFALLAGIATPLLQAVPVRAAGCAVNSGTGGGTVLLDLATSTATDIDTTVAKVGTEITPQANWGANDFVSSITYLADGSCNKVGSISASIASDKTLTISYNDYTRSSAFVVTTDYVDGLATTSSSSNTSASATYSIPAINASVTQLISFDRSVNPGFVDAYLKTGAGTEDLLVSFKAPTGLASFGGGLGIRYSPVDQNLANCAAITGSSEVLARVLLDGVATALNTVSAFGSCPSFSTSSYDSTSKTASMKYETAGITPDKQISAGSGTFTPGGGSLLVLSSLNIASNSFSDYISASNSASQQLYFGAVANADGKNIPKDTPFPVVGFVADMTAADIDLTAKSVTFDVMETADKRAAFAHNVNTISKDGTFSLFAPFKDGDTFIGVCPGATSLDAVTDKCTGIFYLKDGQTKTSKDTKSIAANQSVKASVITVGAKKFWQVDGLTSTGIFGSTLASDPATGISISTTSTTAVVLAVTLTLGLAITARRMNLGKK